MHEMNYRTFDLNLARVLDALLHERNVTRAGDRLGLSQPATSHALRRLREHFDDPLLVAGPDGMRPTPRAEALAAPLRAALGQLEDAVSITTPFEPAETDQRFRVGMSDSIAFTIVPRFHGYLADAAPGARLAVRWADRLSAPAMLAQDQIDLAIVVDAGLPDHLPRRVLLDESYVCAARADHPLFRRPLTVARLVTYPHLFVSLTASEAGTVDRILEGLGTRRRIVLSMPQFLVAAFTLARSDMVAIMARRVVETLSNQLSEQLTLRTRPVPFDLPGYRIAMVWHPRLDRHPPLVWLRGQLARFAGTLDPV